MNEALAGRAPWWRRQIPWPRVARRDHLAAILLMTVLAAVLFTDCVFRGRALCQRDIDLFWYPMIAVLLEGLGQGSWPLWNPYVRFGQPFLAMAVCQLAYPTTWLALVLPGDIAYAVFAVAHVTFTGVGTYVLCRRLGVSWLGSTTAGVLWAASGPYLSLVHMANMFAGVAWLPWSFWAADRALEDGRRGRVLIWGGTVAATVLAGSPEAAVMASVGGILGLRHLHPLRSRRSLAAARSMVLAAAFATALSAVQWLPTVDLLRRSARAELASTLQTYWSNHPYVMAQTVLPIVPEELPLSSQVRRDLYEDREPFLQSLYLGMASLGLVAAGAVLARGVPRRTFLVLGVLAAVLSMGRWTPVYEGAAVVLPVLELVRYPSKFILLTAFCWAVLAGIGLDAWMKPRDGGRGRWLALAVVLPAVAGVAAATMAHRDAAVWSILCVPPEEFGKPYEESAAFRATWVALATTALLTAVAAVGGVLRAWREAALPAVAVLMAAAATVDVAGHTHALIRTVPRALLRYRSPALDALPPRRPNRMMLWAYRPEATRSEDVSMRPPWGDPLDISPEHAFWLWRVYPAAGRHLVETIDGDVSSIGNRWTATMAEALRSSEVRQHDWVSLLRVAGVDYLVAAHEQGLKGPLELLSVVAGPDGNPILTYRVPDPLPRAYVVGESLAADTADTVGAIRTVVAASDFDPRRSVVLDRGPVRREPAFQGSAHVRVHKHDRLEVEAELSHDGHLVVIESYDPWWRAEVDGTPVPVLRANGAFRAVPVPSGRHRVALTYRPLPVYWGLGLTVLGCFAASAVLLAEVRARLAGAR